MISVLPAVLVILIRKGLPESDLWARRKHLIAQGRLPEEILLAENKNRFLTLFSKNYRKIFLFAFILAIFDMSAYWFTYSWLPGYLSEQRGLTITNSALWILVTQAGGFLGYFSFGFASDHFARRPAYSTYSAFWALGLVMVTMFWNTVIAYPLVILGFMFLVGVGTGMFGGYGPLFSELFPTTIRNTAMGSAFNLARGIQFFTPVMIAIIAQQYGLGSGISIAALFALLAGAWVWVFPETRGRNLAVHQEEETVERRLETVPIAESR